METLSAPSLSAHTSFSNDKIKDLCISVLNDEAHALLQCAQSFPNEALILIKKIAECTGRVIFSGMGKSGHIGKKCAATFSSFGIPSFFVHPAEALHGDLGMICKDDCLVFLSKSGRGAELQGMIPYLKEQRIFSALLCCDKGSLTSYVDCVVHLPLGKEACQIVNAPTSSSTLMLAVGDALAVAVSSIKKFTQHDFAHFHPGGTLGRTMLLNVKDLMYSGDALPFLKQHSTFQEILFVMTSKKLGTGIVVDDNKKAVGIITDGDLRRACDAGACIFEKKASDIMGCNPKVIQSDLKALTALQIMEDNNITSLVVAEDDNVIGLVHIHDIIKAGIRR